MGQFQLPATRVIYISLTNKLSMTEYILYRDWHREKTPVNNVSQGFIRGRLGSINGEKRWRCSCRSSSIRRAACEGFRDHGVEAVFDGLHVPRKLRARRSQLLASPPVILIYRASNIGPA